MSADGADGFLGRWAKRKADARVRSSAPEAPPGVDEASGGDAPIGHPKPAATAPAPDASARTTRLPDPVDPRHALASSAPAKAAPAPLPTLADVATLTRDSDYTRFMASGVDSGVRNAALKKLFTDPRFNVMDGLDTYIDDYGKPDPIPLSMLRQMNQSKALGLFADEERAEAERAADPAGSAHPPDTTNGATAIDPETGVATHGAPPALADNAGAGPAGTLDERRAHDDADLRLQQDDGPRRDGAAPGPRA